MKTYIEIDNTKRSTIENFKKQGYTGLVRIKSSWDENWYAITENADLAELAEMNDVDYNPNDREGLDVPDNVIGWPMDVEMLEDVEFEFDEE